MFPWTWVRILNDIQIVIMRGKTFRTTSYTHILSGEAGDSCNSMPLGHGIA